MRDLEQNRVVIAVRNKEEKLTFDINEVNEELITKLIKEYDENLYQSAIKEKEDKLVDIKNVQEIMNVVEQGKVAVAP